MKTAKLNVEDKDHPEISKIFETENITGKVKKEDNWILEKDYLWAMNLL